MEKVKIVASWFAVFWFVVFGLVSFPSFGTILFLVGLAISLPLPQIQDFLSGRGLRGLAKIAMIAVLVIAGAVATPQDTQETPSNAPEITEVQDPASDTKVSRNAPETEPEPVPEVTEAGAESEPVSEPAPALETEPESANEPTSEPEPTPETGTPETEPEPTEESTPSPEPEPEPAEESTPSPEEKIRLITEIVKSKFTGDNKANAVQIRENTEYPGVYNVFVEVVTHDSGPQRLINIVNTYTQEVMEAVSTDCPSVQTLTVRWELSALLHNRVKEYAVKTYERVWNGDETHMMLTEETWPDEISTQLNAPETTPPEPELTPEPEPRRVEYTYVLNTNTKKFHYPGCSSASNIKEANRRTFTGTREEVIAKGYSPCKKCDP